MIEHKGRIAKTQYVLFSLSKSLAEFAALAANEIKFILWRGAPQGGFSCPCGAIHLLYTTQNTISGTSVFFVRFKRTKGVPQGDFLRARAVSGRRLCRKTQ